MALPLLSSERLDIVPFGAGESGRFHRVWGDPEVIWWGPVAEESAPGAYEALLERIAGMPEGMGWSWLIERDSGVLVGDTCLQPAPPEFGGFELGWHLVREHWGRGYATEGTAPLIDHAWSLGLDEVIAVIVPMNLRSIRVAERLEMTRRPGTIPRGNLEHGVWARSRPR